MFKKIFMAATIVGCLIAVPYVFGSFATATPASPCSCCDVCVCDHCVCDASGCTCDTGGKCACSAECCASCCGK